MKKILLIAIPLLLTPTLTACQDKEHSVPYIEAYEDQYEELDFNHLCQLVDYKVPFTLELYSPYCSHCIDLKEILDQYVAKTHQFIYRFDTSKYDEVEEKYEYQKLQEKYPTIFTSTYVPEIYYFKNGEITYSVNSNKFSSYAGLSKIMKNHYISSKISKIATYDGWNKYQENHDSYFVYEMDYDETSLVNLTNAILSNEVVNAKKDILIINKNDFCDNFLEKINEAYGLENTSSLYAFAINNKKVVSYDEYHINDATNLVNLINDYIH